MGAFSIDSKNNMSNDEEELNEKRLQLRQQLKSQLLTLSPASSNHLNTCQNFIPNWRDFDFLEQQGLDCVSRYLQSTCSSFDPFQLPNLCSICQTDYTENWWYLSENRDEKVYFCDQCEQNRMKQKTLEEHRQSMKSAFLQAKENERRLEIDYHKQRNKS